MNDNIMLISEEITEAQLLSAADATEVAEEETSAVTEETTVVDHSFDFTPENLSWSLPIMGKGMLGIFIVTALIVVTVVVLDKVTKIGKKDKKSK